MVNDSIPDCNNKTEILGPVILDLAGCELTEEEAVIVQHPYVGGVIFFLRNFESPEQIAFLVKQIRRLRENILIAVDQEGGRVQRFKQGFTRLPSLQRLALAYTDEKHSLYLNDQFIKDSAWLMASELLAVGVDISFAPVVDADDCMSQVIGDRSFSKNIHLVSKLGQLYISGMHEAGMAATLKHFPGHGAVQADSHLALPVDKRTLDQVWDSDMVPFRELLPISEGVMPAHILFDQIDSMPVGFSTYWLQKMLREKMKYKGIIFSDDLSMEGAAIAGEHSERAVAALTAGCDAVVVCNNSQKAREVLTCLEERRWPINNRLALMRANSISDVYSIEQLRKTDRWNKSVENLHELGG